MRLHTLLARTALVVTATASLLLPSMTPAHAAGGWSVTLSVHQNGGADMVIVDTLNPNLSYLTTLTSTGGGTCSLTTGTAEVYGYSIGGKENHTPGSCDLFNAEVTYTMTWTAGGGAAGQAPVQCAFALGRTPICTPTAFSGHLISGLID